MLSSVPYSYFARLKKFVIPLFILGLAGLIYSEWSPFIAATVEWQKTLHTMLASHIQAVSEDVYQYGGALILLSFGYGIFHAIGPGHGKAVIVTYLGTHKETVRKAMLIAFSAAVLQSLIAILLVSALARMLKFKFSDVHQYGNDMASVSYVLVIGLGVLLIISSIRRGLKIRRDRTPAVHHSHDSHSHDEACGCSHTHVPERDDSIWHTLTVILSMGIRPCSGAIVVLIYAHLVGVYVYGVIATLLMGIGTGLMVSLVALGSLYARSWLEGFVSQLDKTGGTARLPISLYLRCLGGAILIILGWSLFSAASTLSSGHPLF
ncbi:MAG: nickel/cobalt transporter [Pseudomonadales bacterium]|nr:nickel/cobalt transporter [Pseudomonadales bacterium]